MRRRCCDAKQSPAIRRTSARRGKRYYAQSLVNGRQIRVKVGDDGNFLRAESGRAHRQADAVDGLALHLHIRRQDTVNGFDAYAAVVLILRAPRFRISRH